MPAKLLVVEDDAGLRRQYRWALRAYDLHLCSDRDAAIAKAATERPGVAIIDLGLPPDPDGATEGLATIAGVLAVSPATKIIVVTGNEGREHALQSIQLGAYDFCQKPVDIDVLNGILARALHVSKLDEESRTAQMKDPAAIIPGLMSASPVMQKLGTALERVAATGVTVLVQGESGTGKELVARGLHMLSTRRNRPFLVARCGTTSPDALARELFGDGTAEDSEPSLLEAANTGILFLDQVGELSPDLQLRLLRFLELGRVERVGAPGRLVSVDVRVVAACNTDLALAVREGRFREDLFFRLNEVLVRVPPLRDRDDDSVLLASHFLERFAAQYGRRIRGFSDAAIAAIRLSTWEGNVRELMGAVRRAVIMVEGGKIETRDLGLDNEETTAAVAEPETLDLREARRRSERDVLLRALAKSKNNVAAVARMLGVSRPKIYHLLSAHGIDWTEDAADSRAVEA